MVAALWLSPHDDFLKEMPSDEFKKVAEAAEFILEMKMDYPKFRGIVMRMDSRMHELERRTSTLEQRFTSDPPGYLAMDRFDSPTGRFEIQQLLAQHDRDKDAYLWRAIKKHGGKIVATAFGAGIAFLVRAVWDILVAKR